MNYVKAMVIAFVILCAGCSVVIDPSKVEQVKVLCDNNNGVEKILVSDWSFTLSKVTEVKCNNGATFYEDHIIHLFAIPKSSNTSAD